MWDYKGYYLYFDLDIQYFVGSDHNHLVTSNDNHYGGMNLGWSENEHFHDNDSVDMAADMIAILVVDVEEQLENL